MTVQSLNGLTTGRYWVTTASGTRHLVDLDAQTATRYGATGHEWGDKLLVADPFALLSGTNPKVAAHFETVTPDGAPFHFDSIQGATVGECMRLDNMTEWRRTSAIQSIEAA